MKIDVTPRFPSIRAIGTAAVIVVVVVVVVVVGDVDVDTAAIAAAAATFHLVYNRQKCHAPSVASAGRHRALCDEFHTCVPAMFVFQLRPIIIL